MKNVTRELSLRICYVYTTCSCQSDANSQIVKRFWSWVCLTRVSSIIYSKYKTLTLTLTLYRKYVIFSDILFAASLVSRSLFMFCSKFTLNSVLTRYIVSLMNKVLTVKCFVLPVKKSPACLTALISGTSLKGLYVVFCFHSARSRYCHGKSTCSSIWLSVTSRHCGHMVWVTSKIHVQ